jgi:hypothetical protein
VWQEFWNKLECFGDFEKARGAPAGPSPLAEQVARCAALGPYRALWHVEGLGCRHAERASWRGAGPRGLLEEARAGALPVWSLISLHSGMGLGLADHLLGAVPPGGASGAVGEAVRRFVRACEGNAREGYFGAAFEGLGLVARNLYPHLVARINGRLWEAHRDLVGYFWHGVGRGLYFAPTHFVPGLRLAWQGVDKALREPPHELGRLNALAGLAWAVTLVNVRHPRVLERFLARYGGRGADGAFADGVASAVLVWHDWAPASAHVGNLCRHRPDPTTPGLAERWRRLVSEPAAYAVRREYPDLRARHRIGSVFRYRSAGAGPR